MSALAMTTEKVSTLALGLSEKCACRFGGFPCAHRLHQSMEIKRVGVYYAESAKDKLHLVLCLPLCNCMLFQPLA